MRPMIQLKNVSYRYPNQKIDVLKEITLNIYENQFITVLGPNGSGKSTLAKILNGLILPSNGVVIVDGIDISLKKELLWSVRSQVGIVFQNPENQIVANTVEEDAAFGLENQGIEPNIIRVQVDAALEKVGLNSLKLSEPHYLSGGQKQRVAIAGILAMKPKVIIFDEATSMLDPKGKKKVQEITKGLNEAEKITIINITHSLEEALASNRVIIMNEGKIVLDGCPKKIFKERELLKKFGLEVPLIVELAYRLREKGLPLSNDIISEEELTQELWKLF